MANYVSEAINKRTLVRNQSSDDALSAWTAAVKVPASTNLAIGDRLKFMRLDWGVVPTKIIIQVDGALDSNNLLAGTLGTIQIVPGTTYASTNASGVFQTYDLATNTTNVSPATSAASLAAAATINTTFRAGGVIVLDPTDVTAPFATAAANGFTGPVEIAYTATVAGTGANTSDVYVTMTVEFIRRRDIDGVFVDRGGF